MVFRFSRRFLFPLFKFFIKEINGTENIPKKGPFIVAINHSNYMDAPILEYLLVRETKRKVHFVASSKLMQNIVTYLLLQKWLGWIPNSKTTFFHNKTLLSSINALLKGEIILIAPEGTVNKGKLVKAYTGVARMAVEGFPVVPIGLKGVHKIGPSKYAFPRLKRAAIINIGEPIYFNKVPEGKINKEILTQSTRKIMCKVAELADLKYNY